MLQTLLDIRKHFKIIQMVSLDYGIYKLGVYKYTKIHLLKTWIQYDLHPGKPLQ